MDRSSKPGGKSARRTTIIDRKYQFLFAFQVFVVHTIVVLSIFFIVQNSIGQRVLGNTTAEIIGLEALEIDLLSNVLRVGVVTGALVVCLAFWFSHRVVGPIPRLRNALYAASRGDFSVRLQFRPGDALEPVAHDFNRAMIALQKRAAAEVASKETDPADTVETPEPEDLADSLSRSA